MLLLEQIQGFDHKFDWNDKMKCKVHIRPKPLTCKRPSQPKIRLADYVGLHCTTQNLGGYLGKNNTF